MLSKNVYKPQMYPSVLLVYLSAENSITASNENPVFFTGNNNATNQHIPQLLLLLLFLIGFSCNPHVLRTKGGGGGTVG